jgi:DNA-directed RNA polymerase specialized sigma subunit
MARLSSASPRCASWRGENRPGAGHGGCCSPPRPQGSKRPEPRRLNQEQQAFAVRHLGLAQQQARRFAIRHGLAYEDLLGPAYEGLCKAAMGFAPERGHRPSSYVVPKVKGELLHHLRDTGFAVRISHRYRELWIKARRLVAQGRNDREIALALQVPLGVWVEVRMACGVAPVPLERVLEVAEAG